MRRRPGERVCFYRGPLDERHIVLAMPDGEAGDTGRTACGLTLPLATFSLGSYSSYPEDYAGLDEVRRWRTGDCAACWRRRGEEIG